MRKDSDDIFNVLEKMKEHELAMAEYYQAWRQVWSAEKDLWMEMEQAEMRHARYLETMIGFILKKPERFEWSRPLKQAAIQTATSGVRLSIHKLKNGEIPMYKAIFTARDFEQSIIENKYGEMIKTDDIEFRSLIGEIVSDTQSHLAQLNKKIKEWTR